MVSAASARRLTLLAAASLTLLFTVHGLSLIPYAGIQNDEALFAAGVYDPEGTVSVLSVFHRRISMMLISYLGSLKALLYTPILALWGPSPYSVRVPVLLAGAATVWLFFRLLGRVAGSRAAIVGCALLAADPTFLLTTVFDWGPVALQHLLVVGGALALVRFHQKGTPAAVGGGFFLFGLACWDKALFVWTLAGMTAGALSAFPRAVARRCSFRNAALAILCFCLGAFPLLRYNVQQPLDTFRTNISWSAEGLEGKAHVLWSSLDGSGLFGYLVWDEPVEHTVEPGTPLERLSVAVSDFAGRPHRGLMPFFVLAALLLLPLLWSTGARRPMLFAAVLIAVAWGQMLFTRTAGGSVHHTVLLWPWPHFLVAVALGEAAGGLRRYGPLLISAAVAVVCVANLLVANQYRAQFIRHGARHSWSDAIYPLSDFLGSFPAKQVVVVDWGIVDTLRLLHENRLPLRWGGDLPHKQPYTESEKRAFEEMVRGEGRIFVGYTPDHEQITGVNERLRGISEAAGYRRRFLRVIRDRQGRPVYEVFRFEPALPDRKTAED